MPLPADLHTRTVTATFPAATGSALPSSVTFTPTEALTDPTGAVIIPASPVTAPAPFGTASIVLACTDNATISQNGYWAYTVEIVNNGVAAAPYNVLVPTGSGSIDLSTLMPVTLTNPVQGSGITSVNGQAGPVVTLTAAEVGALTAADNLSDLTNITSARTALGLGSAATENVGTSAGTVAAGNDSRIVGALEVANALSELTSNAGQARTNLGLGAQAQQNTIGITSGVLAQVLPPRDCVTAGGSTLTAGFLLLNCVQPGPILATNLGIWLTTAGLTSSGTNALALYDANGNLIDQTADMSTQFAAGGYQEAALGSTHQLSANTNYYLAVLSHFSGTVPKAAAEIAGANIPVMHGAYASLSKSGTASFPSSVTLSTLALSTASYYMTIS